jgi:hypothetical protein
MDYEQLIDSLTPDIVERLRRGVETGRWPDGSALTPCAARAQPCRRSSPGSSAICPRSSAPATSIAAPRTGRGSSERDGTECPLRWADDAPGRAGE